MLLDHAAEVLQLTGLGGEGDDLLLMFHRIGRIAFPICSYLLVNGWRYTKNKTNYMSRIIFFAALSQIPYTIALYPGNGSRRGESGQIICSFSVTYFLIWFLLFAIVYWYLFRKADRLFLMLTVSLMISHFSLKIDGIWIAEGKLNVFYTYAAGMLVMYYLERLADGSIQVFSFPGMLSFFCLIWGSLAVLGSSDYGMAGRILILSLYFCRDSRFLQMLAILIWEILFYGIIMGNTKGMVFSFASLLLIGLYNQKKGLPVKYGFYIFYPAHLLLLGVAVLL